MKKIIFACFMVLLLSGGFLVVEHDRANAQGANIKVVTSVELAIYQSYSNLSFTGERLGTLGLGEEVEVLEAREAASKIRTSDGLEGWVAQIYLADSLMEQQWLLKEGRTLRTAPSTSLGTVLGEVKANEHVYVLEHVTTQDPNSEWYKIRTLNGRSEGWIWGALTPYALEHDGELILDPGYNLIKYEKEKRNGVTNKVTAFTPLNSVANVTAEEINRYIASKTNGATTRMTNVGEYYLEAQNKTGLNAIYLLAHSGLETNWGTSRIVNEKYNYYAIGSVDGNPYDSSATFQSEKDGIIRGAEWIKQNYGIKEWESYASSSNDDYVYDTFFQPTLDNMRNDNNWHEYASDESWAVKIAYFAKDFHTFTFGQNETLKKGWYKDGANWYYFDQQGRLKTGNFLDGGKEYLLRESGIMHTGWLLKTGSWYFYHSSGAKATGWVKDKDKWYYLQSDGKMETGWLMDKGKWYYLNGSGEMAIGWKQINGVWYFLESSGAMHTGWLKSGSTWYHLASSGAMSTGWKEIGGAWYYFYSSGAMAYNTVIDGYKLGSNGAWIR
ncbi:SH3 domain-containing protein [Bacillus tianshenii]|uniref:SH3 domain-containing protein n=1 Tax=Sutcliffiella tianshenii TaxID=1463404 RepID=UPI001CD2A491|nr:SH3 domain-containing protein [Bacillus tianshenii]MCA1320476.1 SH3 domain-containing protein [Bacillus tianshenii]